MNSGIRTTPVVHIFSQREVCIRFLNPSSILKTRSTLDSFIIQIKKASSGKILNSLATVNIKL